MATDRTRRWWLAGGALAAAAVAALMLLARSERPLRRAERQLAPGIVPRGVAISNPPPAANTISQPLARPSPRAEPGWLACGTARCRVGAQKCCLSVMSERTECADANAACPERSYALKCDQPADCAPPRVCCLIPGGADCLSPEQCRERSGWQLCSSAVDCAAGEICRRGHCTRLAPGAARSPSIVLKPPTRRQ